MILLMIDSVVGLVIQKEVSDEVEPTIISDPREVIGISDLTRVFCRGR